MSSTRTSHRLPPPKAHPAPPALIAAVRKLVDASTLDVVARDLRCHPTSLARLVAGLGVRAHIVARAELVIDRIDAEAAR